MPKFYFHVMRGTKRTRDIEGANLPDIEAAIDEATTASRELVANALLKGEAVTDGAFEITDADGMVLLTLPFPTAQV
jgi:hypothetical protein